jgi:hypothetical protein
MFEFSVKSTISISIFPRGTKKKLNFVDQCYCRRETELPLEELSKFNLVHNIFHMEFFRIESCFLRQEI